MTEFINRNDAGNIDFAERIAPIEAAPPAPESFDATAALRHVMAVLADLVEAVGRGDECGLPEAYRAAVAVIAGK